MSNPKPAICTENPANPNNTGVVLDIPMYEGSGTPKDVSSNAFTISTTGSGQSWTTGNWGNCVSLNGSGGYIAPSGAQPATNTSWLAVCGFNTTFGSGQYQPLIDFGNYGNGSLGGNLAISDTGYCYIGSNSAYFASNAPVNDGNWHRAYGWYDHSNQLVILYIDGVLQTGLHGGSPGYTTNGSGVAIGGATTTGGVEPYFTGSLDGVYLVAGVGTDAMAKQDYADWFARFRTISPIQTAPLGHAAASTTASCSFGQLPTVGDGIVVSVWGEAAITTTVSVTDNQSGNTYTQTVLQDSASGIVRVFSAQFLLPSVVGSTSPFTITATTSATATAIDICATEFNPSLTTDQTSGATGNSAAPAPGAVTTTTANEVIVTTFGNKETTNPGTITPPTGFYTSAQELNGATYAVGAQAYEAVSSTQTSLNPTWATDASAVWACVQATYYAGAAPAAPGEDESFIIIMRTNW